MTRRRRTARVLDLSGCVVAPGLIDLHTHLTGEVESGSYGDILMESEADAALLGVRNARRTIDAGFTTVRDVGTFRAFADVSLRKAIDNGLGRRPADALRRRLRHLYRRWRRGDRVLGRRRACLTHMRFGVADSVDEVRRAVRRIMATAPTSSR